MDKYLKIELVGAIILIFFGSWIANPFNESFLASRKVYAPMQFGMPSSEFAEVFWGSIYLLLGLASQFFFRANKLNISAIINFGALLSLSVLFVIGDYTASNWGLYGIFGVFNFFCWREFKWKYHRS